jgi:hypothetical protein
MEDTHTQDRIVKLNVGGIVYHTSLSTLLKDNQSMLAAVFSANLQYLQI